MKQLTKAWILAAGAAVVSQVAQAQFTANDLYLGFVGVGATSNYVINLGPVSPLLSQGHTPTDLSSDFSLSAFVSTFSLFTGGNITNVSMGVVGGAVSGPTVRDLFATALRVGGAGYQGQPGSDLSGIPVNGSTIASAVSDITRVGLPAANSGTVLGAGDGNSWSGNIAPTFTAGTFYGATSINPDSVFDASGVLYEDLWEAPVANGPYQYVGYFTMNPTADSLVFTPAPEPAAVSVFAGGALLFGLLRWRAGSKKA